jgi:hypothetical protein
MGSQIFTKSRKAARKPLIRYIDDIMETDILDKKKREEARKKHAKLNSNDYNHCRGPLHKWIQ